MNIKNKFSKVQEVLINMEEDHISESAAQCAYYVILSFVPFVILLMTLLQYTSIQTEELFNIISKILPSYMNEMIMGIIMEVNSKSIGTISLSLIFVFLSADRGLFALIKGLHQVYNFSDNERKSILYLKLMSMVKTICFIILIVISLVVLVFGSTIVSTMQEQFGLLKNYTIIYEIIAYLILLFVAFIMFLCIYKFIPGYKITFKSQIRGAIFGSIALNIVSFGFSKFLGVFKGFSTIYGSLTTLMLVMMWIYAIFYIIFIGAEINKIYSIKKINIKNIKY